MKKRYRRPPHKMSSSYLNPNYNPKKKKTKFFYVDCNGDIPNITNLMLMNAKCFSRFGDAYRYWLDVVDRKLDKPAIIEVDASTFYSKTKQAYSICYSYRIIMNKKVVMENTRYFGMLTEESNEIKTCGIAEIIGATNALKDLKLLDNYKEITDIIIRYDNKYIENIAKGQFVAVDNEKSDVIRRYRRVYNDIYYNDNKEIYFNHVLSHTGDKAHDIIDRKAFNMNKHFEKIEVEKMKEATA